jgi:tetratricopeptide (TPR) repeat protein
LRLRLTGAQRKRLGKRHTRDAEAYRHYLRGRFHWEKRTEEGFRKSIEQYREAIALDPAYALAYAGLADAHASLGMWGAEPPRRAFPLAKQLAQKARELDDDLAEAHSALAQVGMAYDWDWPRAEADFRRAIELSPGSAVAHARYGYLLMLAGRLDEALARMRHAQRLDPLSLIITANVGYVLYFMGDDDQAVEQFRAALAMDADFPSAHYYLGLVYDRQARYDEAVAAFQKAIALSKGTPGDLNALGHAYAAAGRTAEARAVLDELVRLSRGRYVPPFFIGFSHLALGEADEGFEWLERAYRERDFYMIYLRVDPRLEPIRSDPRYGDLVRRMDGDPDASWSTRTRA